MKLYIWISLSIFWQNMVAQASFEGTVFFTSKFIAKDSVDQENVDRILRYRNMEGDTIQMLYCKQGHIKYVYKNSSDSGMHSYLISPDGSRKMTMKSGKISNPKGRVRFLGKFKVANQTILGLDCVCYQYRFKSEKYKSIIETYCFNSTLPKIDYRLFHLDKNYFERDFFEMAERPYLKHTIESDKFILEYQAYKISIEALPAEIFN
jgi:hypothetical protein